MKEVQTEYAYTDWLARAKKGEKVVYFDGFLMFERQKIVMSGNKDSFPQRIRTGMLAWKSYLDGLVTLVQHRKDEGEYEYIAIRR